MSSKSCKFATLSSARLAGVVTCVPTRRIESDYFLEFFSIEDIKNVEKLSGVKTRYWVDKESTVDLCVKSSRALLENLRWQTSDIDAVIFVSQSPDYVLPASSIKIAGELGLGDGVIAYDVNLGCSGYPYGLFLAETLIFSGIAEKVILAVGETTSKIIDKQDKSTALIFGDAGSASALEPCGNSKSSYVLGSDASGEKNLIVPQSRFCVNTMLDDPRMMGRNHEYIFMDGAEVFNFTLKRVPRLVEDSQRIAGEVIDFYLFHQANKFMLDYLVKKMNLDLHKVPMNISDFGNTSSASIPLLLTTKLRGAIKEQQKTRVGMFGFGVGYSWSSCIKELDSNIILENIAYHA
jgi:3-oxoacyl-[acyl-carrier-protein] synthase-3